MNMKEFAKRRKQLMRMMGEGAVAILPAAPVALRNRDVDYPYRQDSDFYYLSGFPEPEAVIVLIPGRKHGEFVLFCRAEQSLVKRLAFVAVHIAAEQEFRIGNRPDIEKQLAQP